MAAADFPVGHFTLKLVVNKGPLDPITTAYKEENLKGFLESKSHRPERHAIRNLLGVIAFRGKKVQEAKDHFKKILEPDEDPDNLNAKANLDYVERHTLSSEENIPSGAGITASNIGPGISPETEKRRQGRRYAEQAFAFMYENYQESVTHERYSTAMELYNLAMDLAGDLVDRQEKNDWYFGIGLASMKIFKSLRATEHQEAAIKHLKITVSNNCAIIESADRDLKSDAYLHIGIALEEASRRNILDEVDLKVPPNLGGIIRDPVALFKKALEVASSDSSKAKICTRLAMNVRNRDHDFPRAMKYLSESIRLDRSIKHNYHAYSTRAKLCLKQFTFKQKTAGRLGGSPADPYLLTTAKADLKFILTEHVSPRDYFNLAEVYYHLAEMSSGRQSKEYIHGGRILPPWYIQQAMETCSKGEGCQDGADSPDCHKIKGMCLCFIGEHQQALESFKRGVECEEKTGWVCGNAKLMDEEQLHS